MERSDSNAKALKILGLLLLTVAGLFALETKFLVPEIRGESLTRYDKIPWFEKIILLVEDFEGLKNDSTVVKEKFFGYGSVQVHADTILPDESVIHSRTALKITWNGKENYGGWGKGVGKNINLDPNADHLNFRVYVPASNGHEEIIKVLFEEDDNNDGILQQDKDDNWSHVLTVPAKDEWQLVSIPLSSFSDGNPGGDGQLNVTRKGGLHNIIFSLEQAGKYNSNHSWYFDFICFTNAKVKTLK
jgi:hypothetical protein